MTHCAKSQPDIVCACADGRPDNEYVFTMLDLPEDGTCSVINSLNDSLINNSAALTGGAIYSTHVPSLNVTCPSGQQMDPVHGCASWTGNQVHTVATGPYTSVEGYSSHMFACDVVHAFVGESIRLHTRLQWCQLATNTDLELLMLSCAALAILPSLFYPSISSPTSPYPPSLPTDLHYECLWPCACIHTAG